MCELAKGFSDGGKVPDKRGAVVGHAEKGTQLSRISRFNRVLKRFNFLRGGARPSAGNMYPKNSMLGLLNSLFVGLTVRPDS